MTSTQSQKTNVINAKILVIPKSYKLNTIYCRLHKYHKGINTTVIEFQTLIKSFTRRVTDNILAENRNSFLLASLCIITLIILVIILAHIRLDNFEIS